MFPCSHLKKSKVFTVFRLRHLRLLICLPAQPVTVDSREVRYFILQGYGGSSPINVKDGHNPSPRKTRKLSITLTLRTFFIYNTLGHDRIRILSPEIRFVPLFPNIFCVPLFPTIFLFCSRVPHYKIHRVPLFPQNPWETLVYQPFLFPDFYRYTAYVAHYLYWLPIG